MAAEKISTADAVKTLLILLAVIAVLSLIYFVVIKPATSLAKAVPGSVLPFGLGAVAGGLFANKFLKGNGSPVQPTGDPNAPEGGGTSGATTEQTAATEEGAATTEDAAAATGDAAAVEETGGALEGISAEELIFLGL